MKAQINKVLETAPGWEYCDDTEIVINRIIIKHPESHTMVTLDGKDALISVPTSELEGESLMALFANDHLVKILAQLNKLLG